MSRSGLVFFAAGRDPQLRNDIKSPILVLTDSTCDGIFNAEI
jgi:hypothetical protein